MNPNNITVLQETNPWWSSGSVKSAFVGKVERVQMPALRESLDERPILMLQGPRRVGKTCMMFHLIRFLLTRTDPRTIFYLSLDDPLIDTATIFQDIVEYLETFVFRKAISEIGQTVYLFLDEVTKLENWERYLKRYHNQHYPFKFIVSSSSTAFLEKRTKESLVGRIVSYEVFPFSFTEYLRLKDADERLLGHYGSLQEIWERFGRANDFEALFRALQEVDRGLFLYSKAVLMWLTSYLSEGGFPEYLQLENPSLKDRYFWENVAQRVIYYDIPSIFHANDRVLLQKLLLHGIFHSGSILNIQDVAQSYGATRQNVSHYLQVLQAGMLIHLLEKWAKTQASRQRAYKKIYTVDTGLFAHLQRLTFEKLQASGRIGDLAEIAVLAQLRRLFYDPHLYYFREREKEVDFVVDRIEGPLPVEVKYREKMGGLEGLSFFRRKFEVAEGLVVTKDRLRFEGGLLYVPLRLFLW